MKILITGAKGQLATEFIEKFKEKGIDCIAFSRAELDITVLDKAYKLIKEANSDIVINCAAYNNVDEAEKEPHQAYKVNALGVYNLSVACRDKGIKLIHYSTDYVFDGTKQGMYTEEDKPNPINEYGKSKLFGELFIQEILDKYLIFRTSWVYGEGTQNFLYKLEQWAKERDVLKIAVDEFSVPTSTRTIVEVTMKAIDAGLTGLYHLVNSGYASRYEWAKEYFRIKGINKLILPAYQADFNLLAKRPLFSAMNNDKVCKALKTAIQDWHKELKNFVMEA